MPMMLEALVKSPASEIIQNTLSKKTNVIYQQSAKFTKEKKY
jgi:hypothetical protein